MSETTGDKLWPIPTINTPKMTLAIYHSRYFKVLEIKYWIPRKPESTPVLFSRVNFCVCRNHFLRAQNQMVQTLYVKHPWWLSLHLRADCLFFDVLFDNTDPLLIRFYEAYTSRPAFQAHLDAPHTKACMPHVKIIGPYAQSNLITVHHRISLSDKLHRLSKQSYCQNRCSRQKYRRKSIPPCNTVSQFVGIFALPPLDFVGVIDDQASSTSHLFLEKRWAHRPTLHGRQTYLHVRAPNHNRDWQGIPPNRVGKVNAYGPL